MKRDAYAIDNALLQRHLRHIALADTDRMMADRQTRNYYLNNSQPLWVSRSGVNSGADSVLSYIAKVASVGFNPEKFRYTQIKADLNTLRNLDFGQGGDAVERVIARLDYSLTKAYMRYCTGMRYGFTNPAYILNRLDQEDTDDTLSVRYKTLYDVPMRHPDKQYFSKALESIASETAGQFLAQSQTRQEMYDKLCGKLATTTSRAARIRILCNIERCRWQTYDSPSLHKKYILVNLPSQELDAVDDGNWLSMRIGCGAADTKTPLLTSRIKRIDLNPQWVIPRSIIKKSILKHAGDPYYFERHNYFVRNRKTGDVVQPEAVTYDMLASTDYNVVQKGGESNALGRVIFRFDNNFSVFLHDTSSRDVFERGNRSISHGCIRVQKPFDLAVFMLKDKDETLIDKINYTMTVQTDDTKPTPEGESEHNAIDKQRYLHSLNVEPQIPIFITYYTIYPDSNGVLQEYGDIYGYDKVIYEHLQSYM